MQVEAGGNLGEETELLRPGEQRTNCFGRAWNWIKTNKFTVLKGAAAVVSTAGLTALGYLVGKGITHSQEASSMHPMGIGVGIAAPVFIGSILPQRLATNLADFISRWGFEILLAITEFYVRAGCPIQGRGFWDPANPPLLARQLSTLALSATATGLTALSLRTFLANNNEEMLVRRDPPLTLFLEGGVHDNRRLVLEQLPKLGLCLLSAGLYRWEGSEEWLDFAYYLLGHVAGTFVSKAFLWLRYQTIEQSDNRALKTLINKVGTAAELLCFGAFLAWSSDASYLLSGAFAGAVKIAVLDKFQYLSRNDEEVRPIEYTKISIVAKGLFLALNFTWFISMICDPALPTSQRAGIAMYLASSLFAYPMTRYLAANFHPESEDRPLFNSLRFNFVNFEEALLLPYMFIKDSDDVGVIGSDNTNQLWVKPWIGLTSLGLSVGNNRALQGIRNHRTPSNVSDLALLISWFILYRQWQK